MLAIYYVSYNRLAEYILIFPHELYSYTIPKEVLYHLNLPNIT